ncbi:MAG: hypothetical protein K8R08_02670 [Methanosarcinales archaeon]|nr:hypothetical protein [Methanosarcinales archaeon]
MSVLIIEMPPAICPCPNFELPSGGRLLELMDAAGECHGCAGRSVGA